MDSRRPERGTRRIPVAAPVLRGREREYVLDCLDSTWISSAGRYVDEFERAFAEFCGVRHAVACCNGTVAVHLALLAAGVGPGDEVIVPTLTYVASANPVLYCGATPVFVDAEPATWNLDPEAVTAAVTPRTKAIVVVHLYGHPADMDPILAVAREHGIAVVEDAAEAHGAEYRGRRVGGLGDVGTFSFYGNKIITTGEGGMVTCDSDETAALVRQLRGQGQDPQRRYWFPIVGFNYRMTNVAAAIGLGQLETIDWHLERRKENAAWYQEELGAVPGLELSPEAEWARSVFWISCMVLPGGGAAERDRLMERLAERGIETRPFFYPMHTLPPYIEAARGGQFPVATVLAERGINLPSGAGLERDDVAYIGQVVREELAAG
jgi:perosamine synthetase